jgi:L-alanine-DL-glutamate epimerase-like enolase superfamily enzyme
MKTTILNASVEFIEQPFLQPLQLSSGLITKATEARVRVRVRVGEEEGEGRGSIYLSDLWAWPSPTPDREAKDAAMRALCQKIASDLPAFCGGEAAHPLELGLRLHHSISQPDEVPLLARSVCASPFDAAIHDATGQALGQSAFRFYESDTAIPSADQWFSQGTISAIRQTLRPPVDQLDAWLIVGANDDLEEKVRPAVEKTGIHCFKLKTLAKDNAADAARTAEVFQAARRWGLSPVLSIDSNEGNPNAASVLDYLERLEALDPDAYAALSYLEQPTARDILAAPQDWSTVSQRRPVMLDEGLTSLDLLPTVKEQHWTGLALKTCKGHSFTLIAAAWARENGLQLSLQDLTNPGYSAIHSFLVGAHIATLNGVELNSPQYTPAANEPWLPTLSGLFEPRQGVHQLKSASPIGLGSNLVSIS